MSKDRPHPLRAAEHYLFNIAFFAWFFLFSMLYIPALTAVIGLTWLFTSEKTAMRCFRGAINWYGAGIIRGAFPLARVRYRDCSRGEGSGPFLIVANHRSAVDAFLLAFLPLEFVQVVNIWPFRIPILGIYAKWAGYLNIRQTPQDEFMDASTDNLKKGVSLAFFPEGTRSRGREMGPFHSMAFRLALRTGVPIIPYCIAGAEKVMPRGAKLLRRGTISIRRLRAIPWEEYKDKQPFQLKNYIHGIMAAELDRMEKAS